MLIYWHSVRETISAGWCECTENVRKEKYVCKIFAVLINLYVNSRINGFQDLVVFTIIVFLNTRKTFSKEALFLKACHRVVQSKTVFLSSMLT